MSESIICFCYSHLTDIQKQDLKIGKAVFCPVCKTLMWMENGKIQRRKAHQIKKEA